MTYCLSLKCNEGLVFLSDAGALNPGQQRAGEPVIDEEVRGKRVVHP